MDEFKIVEVRAPLVVAATAETVEKSVSDEALSASSALTADGLREQAGEDPMRLSATGYARTQSITVEEVCQCVVVHPRASVD